MTESTTSDHQEAAQLYQRVEELKGVLSGAIHRKRNLFLDPEAWSRHQEFQSLCQQLLLQDLEYSLNKKIENDLWSISFKDYITLLQTTARDRSPLNKKKATEAQTILNWILDTASGFYIVMLEQFRTKFNMDFPFLRCSTIYGLPRYNKSSTTSGVTTSSKSGDDSSLKNNKTKTNNNNLTYIVQHCLVHLGDIARYKNQMRQAETYYRQALQTSPGSGQSYNQLALLEANRGDKLGCVFFYVRSVCLKFPFPAAASNLGKYFNQVLDELRTWPIKDTKVNGQTFIPYMLRFQGLLHHASHLKTAAKLCHLLGESLNGLIAAEQLTSWQLIQLVSINMFLVQGIYDSNPADSEEDCSRDEKEIAGLVCESMAAMLNAFLLPVYTLKQGKALLNYFALPATKLILDWIVLNPRVLNERGFLRRMQIWPSLCRMLNELAEVTKGRGEGLEDYPMTEDYDLQAFSPLWPRLKTLNFRQVTKKTDESPNEETIQFLRAKRLLDLGQEFASESFPGKKLISSGKSFKAIEQQIPESLLKELDGFAVESSSEDEDEEEESESVEIEESPGTKSKIAGILKVNPSSPEKQPAVQTNIADASPPTTPAAATTMTNHKKVSLGGGSRTNVAMAAIMRQAQANAHRETSPEKENRQVTFKSPSPAPVVASSSSSSQPSKKNSSGGARPDFSRSPPGVGAPGQQQQPRPSLGMVGPAASAESPLSSSQQSWSGTNILHNRPSPGGARPHGRYHGGLGLIPDRASTDTFYGGQRPPRMRPRNEEPGSVMGGPGFNSPQRFVAQSQQQESRNHHHNPHQISDFGYDLRPLSPSGGGYGHHHNHQHKTGGGNGGMYYNHHPAARGSGGGGAGGRGEHNQLLNLLGQTNGVGLGGQVANNGYQQQQPYNQQHNMTAARNNPSSSSGNSGAEAGGGSYSLFAGSSWSGGPSSVLGSYPRDLQQQQQQNHRPQQHSGGGGGHGHNNMFGSGQSALESLLNQQRKQ